MIPACVPLIFCYVSFTLSDTAPALSLRQTSDITFTCSTRNVWTSWHRLVALQISFKPHMEGGQDRGSETNAIRLASGDSSGVRVSPSFSNTRGLYRVDGQVGEHHYYSWLKLTLPDVKPSDYGSYQCTVVYMTHRGDSHPSVQKSSIAELESNSSVNMRSDEKLLSVKFSEGLKMECRFGLSTATAFSTELSGGRSQVEWTDPDGPTVPSTQLSGGHSGAIWMRPFNMSGEQGGTELQTNTDSKEWNVTITRDSTDLLEISSVVAQENEAFCSSRICYLLVNMTGTTVVFSVHLLDVSSQDEGFYTYTLQTRLQNGSIRSESSAPTSFFVHRSNVGFFGHRSDVGNQKTPNSSKTFEFGSPDTEEKEPPRKILIGVVLGSAVGLTFIVAIIFVRKNVIKRISKLRNRDSPTLVRFSPGDVEISRTTRQNSTLAEEELMPVSAAPSVVDLHSTKEQKGSLNLYRPQRSFYENTTEVDSCLVEILTGEDARQESSSELAASAANSDQQTCNALEKQTGFDDSCHKLEKQASNQKLSRLKCREKERLLMRRPQQATEEDNTRSMIV